MRESARPGSPARCTRAATGTTRLACSSTAAGPSRPPSGGPPGHPPPRPGHFLAEAGALPGRQLLGFTPDAEHRLLGHGWPGNVRELQETIARIAEGLTGGSARGEHLALATPGPAPAWMPIGNPPPLKEIHDAYIDHVIVLRGGNKTRAAQLLGIARDTLRTRSQRREPRLPGENRLKMQPVLGKA